MNFKLIATDIDGTLVNSDKKLTARTIEDIQKARELGIHVVLCTGRPLSGILKYLCQLGLTGNNDFAIIFNGAQAINIGTKNIIFENGIAYNEYVHFLEFSNALNIKSQIVTSDSKIYVTNQDISKYTIRDAFHTNMDLYYRSMDNLPSDIKGTKFMWVDSPEKISNQMNFIPLEIKEKYAITLTAPYFLEFNNHLATKGYAILELAKKLNISSNEILAIGDGNNDISMLTQVGFSIAMGNANDKVKKLSSVITNDNDHDGVALAIEKYILNN